MVSYLHQIKEQCPNPASYDTEKEAIKAFKDFVRNNHRFYSQTIIIGVIMQQIRKDGKCAMGCCVCPDSLREKI